MGIQITKDDCGKKEKKISFIMDYLCDGLSPRLECNLWQRHILQPFTVRSQALKVGAECWFWHVLRQERTRWWEGGRVGCQTGKRADNPTGSKIESRPRPHEADYNLGFIFLWMRTQKNSIVRPPPETECGPPFVRVMVTKGQLGLESQSEKHLPICT